jgi:hypothetical protein
MAVGDVWTFDFRMGRKEFAIRPGRFVVVAKAWFQQAASLPVTTDYVTFGYLQLIYGQGPSFSKLDEGVAYLGAFGWADPSDLTTIEATRGGAVVVDAVLSVDAQAGPNPEPGRLIVQSGARFAKLHNGRLIVIEIAELQEPISFRFKVPLSQIAGVEKPAAVLQRLAKQAGGSGGG